MCERCARVPVFARARARVCIVERGMLLRLDTCARRACRGEQVVLGAKRLFVCQHPLLSIKITRMQSAGHCLRRMLALLLLRPRGN